MGHISFLLPTTENLAYAIFALENEIKQMKDGDTHKVEYQGAVKDLIRFEYALRVLGIANDGSGN